MPPSTATAAPAAKAAATAAPPAARTSSGRLLKYGAAIAFVAWFANACANYFSRSIFGLQRELYPLEEWVSLYDEDAIDTDIAIFDPHHHAGDVRTWDKGWPVQDHWFFLLWWISLKPSMQDYYALQLPGHKEIWGVRNPQILPYEGEEILADMRGPGGRGHNVVGSIFLDTGWVSRDVDQKCMEPVKEADAAADLHRRYPQIINGIVPFANLSLGAEVEPALQYYKKNPLVVGIRHGLSWAEGISRLADDFSERGMSAYDAEFREGFALLSKYGFAFDAWLYHTQVEELIDLAKAFPNTTVVVDHIAQPLGIGGYRLEESTPVWEERMRRLAELENVYVKVGGMGMKFMGFGFDERPKPPTSDELAKAWGPYALFVIETFGVDRCMMESNFPMDKVSSGYTVLFNALKKITRGYSKEDRRKMFELNAKRVYNIK